MTMDTNQLPESITAYEYAETCGNTDIGGGISMVDDDTDEVICRLTAGTVREKKIALLWQGAPKLLEWAKEACESERAFWDAREQDRDSFEPSWLAELEAAVKACEKGKLES